MAKEFQKRPDNGITSFPRIVGRRVLPFFGPMSGFPNERQITQTPNFTQIIKNLPRTTTEPPDDNSKPLFQKRDKPSTPQSLSFKEIRKSPEHLAGYSSEHREASEQLMENTLIRVNHMLNDSIPEDITRRSASQEIIEAPKYTLLWFGSPPDKYLVSSERSQFTHFQDPDGKGHVWVREGHAAIAHPNENTAIMTMGVLSCYAYALHLRGPEGTPDSFPIMHFRGVDNRESLQEYLDQLPPEYTVRDVVFSVPYEGDAAEPYIEGIREIFRERYPDFREPTEPYTHSEMSHTGLIFTNDGGRFISMPPGRTVYQTETTWQWIE